MLEIGVIVWIHSIFKMSIASALNELNALIFWSHNDVSIVD